MGIILGLSAGFAPGPLLALVVSETMRHGIKSGIKVAVSPFFTDLPIIVLTLFVLSRLAGFHQILGIISMLGGAVILFMGVESMHPRVYVPEAPGPPPRSLLKGILANALSPHPYLFWFGVGGPVIRRAMSLNPAAPFAFIGSFYLFLVGSKIVLAVIVGRSRSFLNGRVYLYTMRILGLALCVLAILLFYDGLKLTGVVD